MATWAGKSVVAFQMLQQERGLVREHPTPMQLDASAVTDGVKMEKVSRQMRFQAARLGMLRLWQADRVLKLLKTNTEDMRADILTKPVNPRDKFSPKQHLLLTGSVRPSSSSRSIRPPVEPRGVLKRKRLSLLLRTELAIPPPLNPCSTCHGYLGRMFDWSGP